MFGFSLIRTKKLTAVYEWLAKLITDKVRNQNTLSMEIKGKIIQNLSLQSGTSKAGKAWSKASILIETEGQYPKKVVLDNMKNPEEFSKLAVGFVGVFHIEINSNEFNGRWYTSVNCWKWEASQAQQPYTQPQQSYQQPPSAQSFYGQPQTYPVNPQSTTPTLDSMGVKGYQQGQYAQQTQMAQNGDDDLPF